MHPTCGNGNIWGLLPVHLAVPLYRYVHEVLASTDTHNSFNADRYKLLMHPHLQVDGVACLTLPALDERVPDLAVELRVLICDGL